MLGNLCVPISSDDSLWTGVTEYTDLSPLGGGRPNKVVLNIVGEDPVYIAKSGQGYICSQPQPNYIVDVYNYAYGNLFGQ